MRYSEMMVNRMTEIIKYDEMKSTREQWLGEIPASWGTLRLKRIFTIKKDIAGEEGHTVLSVTQKGIRPKVMSEKGQFALDYSKYQLVNRGEFVMNHMDLLAFGTEIVIGYLIFLAVYLLATYIIYNVRYTRGRKKIKLFYNRLKKVSRLYENESRQSNVEDFE